MLRASIIVVALLAAVLCSPAAAHPVPFSYIDVRLDGRTAELTIVVHTFDAAHDLNVDPPELLLDSGVLAAQRDRLNALIAGRLRLSSDGEAVMAASWGEPVALASRQSVQVKARYELPSAPGASGRGRRPKPCQIASRFVFAQVTRSARLSAG